MIRFWKCVSVVCFALTSAFSVQAQPDNYPASVTFDFKLPLPTSNKAYRSLMSGIADFNLAYRQPIVNKLIIGGGFKYAYFKVNDLKTPQLTDGKWYNYNAFAEIGYQHYFTDRIWWDLTARGGMAALTIKSDICSVNYERAPERTTAFQLEPTMSLNMIGEDNLAFGLTFSYIFIMDEFDPTSLCLAEYNNTLIPEHTSGIYQSFGVGFSATILIGKNRPFQK